MVQSNFEKFKEQIDTLTEIDKRVINQKFYEIDITDYIDVDEGNAPWADTVSTWATLDNAGDGLEGFDSTTSTDNRTPEVDVGTTLIHNNRMLWKKIVKYNIAELEQMRKATTFDVVSKKLEARKKNYDLLLQKLLFIGNPISGNLNITGLLNNSNVNVDTTSIPQSISTMTGAQLSSMCSDVINAYYSNSDSTAMFDTIIMPASDFNGLGTASDPNFQIKSKIEYIKDAFMQILSGYGINDVKIMPSVYCDSTKSPTGKNTYVFYKKDADVLSLDIPVPYTTGSFMTQDDYNFNNMAYAQLGGVKVFRPKEILYFNY